MLTRHWLALSVFPLVAAPSLWLAWQQKSLAHRQSSAQWRILMAIAEADAELNEREFKEFDRIQKAFAVDASERQRSVMHRPELGSQYGAVEFVNDARLFRYASTKLKKRLYLFSLHIVWADGEVNRQEERYLNSLARSLGLDDETTENWRNRFFEQQGISQLPSGEMTRHAALKALGLVEGATHAEIRRNYRQLAGKYHPDRHQNSGDPRNLAKNTENMQRIQAAWQVLKPKRRN